MSFATVDDYKYYHPDSETPDVSIQQELDFASDFISRITQVSIETKPRSDTLNKLCVKICHFELNPDEKKEASVVSEALEGYSYAYNYSKSHEQYYGVPEIDIILRSYLASKSTGFTIRGGVL